MPGEGDPVLKTPKEAEIKHRPPFVKMIEVRQRAVNSLLCIGLDPDIDNIPDYFKESVEASFLSEDSGRSMAKVQYDFLLETEESRDIGMLVNSQILEEFDKAIIDETHDLVSGYKPNIAFYERYAEYGVAALRRVIKYIKKVDESIPVILDAKRADIGATNKGYAEMIDAMGADAVTVNPYFGVEGKGALGPFLNLKNTGLIILCRTSNPEAARMQDQIIEDEKLGRVPKYMMVAHMAEEARKVNPSVSIVVGATAPEQLKEIRKVFKGNILVPGLGKQGGKAEDLLSAFNEDELGIIANNASEIIHASKDNDFAEKAREAALEWRDNINKVRVPDAETVVENLTPAQRAMIEMMLTAEVDGKLTRRYGESGSYEYKKEEGRFPMMTISQNEHEFVGAAHLNDPQNSEIPLLDYYLNLRGGTCANYETIASALAEIEFSFDFDYITGIPTTGNAIAEALAERLGVSYIPILEKPTEGVDRKFVIRKFGPDDPKPEPGMKPLLVDDLITGAVTKFDAENVLEEEGIKVAGHAVGYDREEGGVEEMEANGKIIVSAVGATQAFAFDAKRTGSDIMYKRIVKKNIQKRLAKSSKS